MAAMAFVETMSLPAALKRKAEEAFTTNAAGETKKVPQEEVAGFVRTLFTLLRVCDPQIVSWSDDGAAMLIHDPARFAGEVCPKFFRHRNFNSFTRLLNMYQFHKVPSTGRDKAVVFVHPCFKRDGEENLSKIQRKGAANAQNGASSHQSKDTDKHPGVGAKKSRQPRPSFYAAAAKSSSSGGGAASSSAAAASSSSAQEEKKPLLSVVEGASTAASPPTTFGGGGASAATASSSSSSSRQGKNDARSSPPALSSSLSSSQTQTQKASSSSSAINGSSSSSSSSLGAAAATASSSHAQQGAPADSNNKKRAPSMFPSTAHYRAAAGTPEALIGRDVWERTNAEINELEKKSGFLSQSTVGGSSAVSTWMRRVVELEKESKRLKAENERLRGVEVELDGLRSQLQLQQDYISQLTLVEANANANATRRRQSSSAEETHDNPPPTDGPDGGDGGDGGDDDAVEKMAAALLAGATHDDDANAAAAVGDAVNAASTFYSEAMPNVWQSMINSCAVAGEDSRENNDDASLKSLLGTIHKGTSDGILGNDAAAPRDPSDDAVAAANAILADPAMMQLFMQCLSQKDNAPPDCSPFQAQCLAQCFASCGQLPSSV
eukprot:CAMPEP_0118893934 /NCGR_PEP_ID=MMETSP1166-20130328/2935_1 /TAXON_ID=1104430 /ORGANISM="Chrysoreinhardia sp, Strain CCMP3193" /LENGTH=607 /DNA_ID=CAMNT_0006832801 /DNA_START=774 /DNA_END=2597 /DNA_ORIENTATION=-